MKKLFLLLLVLPLAFFACGDDDDKKPGEEDLDKMTIEEYMKEDRPFKWNGDWNDPSDPNYKKEGYNPLADTYWLSNKHKNTVIHFSKDFQFTVYEHVEVDGSLRVAIEATPYIINNRGYQIERGGNLMHVIYGVSDNDKAFYENFVGPKDNTTVERAFWVSYTRYYPK